MSLELAPGTLIDGRYVVETLLGKGGMAEVYRVRHAHLDTQHALKVLTLGGHSLQTRLMQEGRVQAALRHPNIVAVSDVVQHEGSMGLVMEYIQGPPLDELLVRKDFTEGQVDALAVGILDGVAAAHALDLIHRDLKPANVMLDVSSTGLIPKVADFGLVKLVAEDSEGFASKTHTGTAMGTPAYMAPEQIRDAKNVDARADVWSLGAILWELVVGERCFDAPDILDLMVLVAGGQRPALSEVLPDAPQRIVDAIEGALVVDRDARIPDVRTLRRIWLEGASVPAEPWTAEDMALIRSLGSGGEEAGDFLRRSFRSQEHVNKARPTAVPRTSDVDTVQRGAAQTFAEAEPEAQAGPGAITYGPDANAAVDAVLSAETLAPPDALDDDSLDAPAPPVVAGDAESSGRVWTAVGVGGIGLLLLLSVGAVAAIGAIGGFGLAGLSVGGSTPTRPPDGPVMTPVPEPAPAAAPDAVPAPAVPEPAPPPVEPAPVPQPDDAPEPAPAADPAPEDPAPAPPDPVPDGTADPEPASGGTVSVALDTQGVSVSFLDGAKRPVLPPLPPGDYQVVAFFEEQVPSPQGTVSVGPGDSVRVKCVPTAHRCVVKTSSE